MKSMLKFDRKFIAINGVLLSYSTIALSNPYCRIFNPFLKFGLQILR